jgi:hypothetical protein
MQIKPDNSTPRRAGGVFPRTGLARQLAVRLLGRDPLFNYGRSGLFLAGPRRTGKSTFLEHDLMPQIPRLGALPIYIDLWSKPGADPAELIADAVRNALRKADGPVTKAGRALHRIKKINLKTKVKSVFEAEFGVEIDTVGQKDGASLAQAFKALNEHTRKPIVLIIDEVQHTLTTQAGSEMLFSLKSARDALNLKTPATPQLVILATGSVRSKISSLVLKKGEAFYGAAVADFPPLDASFVEFALRTRLAHLRADALPTTPDAVKAFHLVGNRPEDFDLILQQAVTSGKPMGEVLTEYAVRRRVEMLNELKRQLAALTPLQRAVLRRMADEDARFAPFTADALAFYAKCCGGSRVRQKFTNGDVQRALDSLERKHRLVWRSARGAYALDDHMIGDLLNEERVADEMRLLTASSTADLSPQELREYGFFQDVPEEEWPGWEA